jgi:hypothetical protein
MYAYHNIKKLSRNHCCRVKNKNYYIFCVCVCVCARAYISLLIQQAKRMLRIILSVVASPSLPVLPHSHINRTIFGKTLLKKKNVYLDFFTTFLSNISHFKNNGVNLKIHFNLVLRLKTCGSIPALTQIASTPEI